MKNNYSAIITLCHRYGSMNRLMGCSVQTTEGGWMLLSAAREKHWVQISISRNTKEKGESDETENSVVNRTPH